MGVSGDVRASRDGDRFHYYWAAVRALGLLELDGDLKAIYVEGLPEDEQADGEEVVDVAEYFGGEDIGTPASTIYSQVKHSTKRVSEEITASELEKTLRKFAGLYRTADEQGRSGGLTFAFVANRVVNDKVRSSLEELREQSGDFTHPTEAKLLQSYMGFGLDRHRQVEFCRRLEIRDGGPGIVEMEDRLVRSSHRYLPGNGTGAELALLTELISRRATSLASSQRIVREDVLLALRVTSEELFPAPSKIEVVTHPVRTPDADAVEQMITEGVNRKVLLTGGGGLGKSVLTSQLGAGLPVGSVVIVYDCFAGGDYRKVSAQRHHHRAALTQVVNELASRGLCSPLIPAPADEGAYVRLFKQRIEVATAELSTSHPAALVVVVVDAADNAAIAARDLHQRSFASDLLREDWPSQSRLVVLCRPERKNLLEVPQAGVTELQLGGFTKESTLEHVRGYFRLATEPEGAELHALSSGNPRVQRMVLADANTVEDAIESLQLASKPSEEPLDSLLAVMVDRIVDEGHLAQDDAIRLCEALAALHPSIPLADLASIAQLSVPEIESFAIALGRGLHLTATTLQFRDEPTETWFRCKFGLDEAGKRALVHTMERHAGASTYVANTLPQLMLEAGMLDELVDLALSDERLRSGDDLASQEIVRSRARFALSATLRADRHADGARLAVRSGALSSGRSRKLALFRGHSDLTARFLGREFVEEICGGRDLASDWVGSNLHVEAVLLSHVDELQDLARARFRSAWSNLHAIMRARDEATGKRDHRDHVTADVVADLAMASANLDGPEGLVDFLGRWSPEVFVNDVAVRVLSRLADADRADLLEHVATAGAQAAQIAAAEVMYTKAIRPSEGATKALVEMLKQRTTVLRDHGDRYGVSPGAGGVVWAVTHGIRAGLLSAPEALSILQLHVPENLPDNAGSRWAGTSNLPTAIAVAVRTILAGEPLDLTKVAGPELAKTLFSKNTNSGGRQAREFRENIEPMLPWLVCMADALLHGPSEATRRKVVILCSEQLSSISDYNTPYVLLNTVAEVATRLLAIDCDASGIKELAQWHSSADRHLSGSRVRLLNIAFRHPHLEAFGLEVLARGAYRIQQDRLDSDSRVESLIDLARTVVHINEAEAEALFLQAMQEAEMVGDDLASRWEALLGTASAIGTGSEPARAYRLLQIGEALDESESVDASRVGASMLAIHAPTCLAAVSRVRDRRSMDWTRLMRSIFVTGGDSGSLRGRLALHAFNPDIAWKATVGKLSGHVRTRVEEAFEDLNQHWAEEDVDEPHLDKTSSTLGAAGADLGECLSQHDFTTEEGWTAALIEVPSARDRRALAAVALSQHPTERPLVLSALVGTPRARQEHFAALALEAASQPATPAQQAALSAFAQSYAMRFAAYIAAFPFDDGSLDLVASACGKSSADLRLAAFRELGTTAHELEYPFYFRLAAMLAQSVEPEAAMEVFDDLAALFDDIAPADSTSDGPFKSDLVPTKGGSMGVAGIIWTALGDVSAAVRWDAAHAVVLLARMECNDELDCLLSLADGSASPAAFLDSQLPFYALYARHWLLVAVARSSVLPDPGSIARFANWMLSILRSKPHAANWALAQQGLRRLTATGVVSLASEDADLVSGRFVANWVEIDWQERYAHRNKLKESSVVPVDSEVRFFLDFDDWCGELADVFSLTNQEIERRVGVVVTKLEGFQHLLAGRDPRRDADAYGDDSTYGHHTDWPEADDLRFYLGLQSLLIVGAELAADTVAYKDPDLSDDSYTEWLGRFLPTRTDGRWLSDCRDAPPSPDPERLLLEAAARVEWPWTMSKSDFEQIVGADEPWITVWANIDNASDGLSEEVRVESALVPRSSARSLLIAMQTASGASLRLPAANDHEYPDAAPYRFVPWIETGSRERGLDRLDSRAAGLRFPPPRLTEAIVDECLLLADPDMRTWHATGQPALLSRMWSNTSTRPRDHENGSSGTLLRIDRGFLTEVLNSADMCLALQVLLRHQRVVPYHERRKRLDDEFEWLEYSRKIYLVHPDGKWHEY